jgi:hypothetical protein
MAVSYIGSGGAQTGTTSLVVTGVATTPLVGDLLMMFVYHNNVSDVAIPSGWTRVISQGISATGTLGIFYKYVSSAGTQANETITTVDCAVGSMACFRGVHSTVPFKPNAIGSSGSYAHTFLFRNSQAEGTYGLAAGATGTSIAATAGDMAVALTVFNNDASCATWVIEGVAATEIADGLTTLGNDGGGAWAYRDTTAETIDDFTVAVTEGSAGTATNNAQLWVLAQDSGAPAAGWPIIVQPPRR